MVGRHPLLVARSWSCMRTCDKTSLPMRLMAKTFWPSFQKSWTFEA